MCVLLLIHHTFLIYQVILSVKYDPEGVVSEENDAIAEGDCRGDMLLMVHYYVQ